MTEVRTERAEPADDPPAEPPAAPSRPTRRPIVLAAAATALVVIAVAAGLAWRAADDPGPDAFAPTSEPGWTLTFADEFDGTTIDAAKWYVSDDGRGDEVESPKDSTCPRADNVSVADGILTMRTRRAEGGCSGGQAHSGAGLTTEERFTQAGGRFEARARWTQRGNYLWGGFWTHGNIGTWDRADPSEIDVFEYIGKDAEPNLSRFKPAIHYDYTCSGDCGMQNLEYQPYDVTAWHTYAVEWQPTDPDDPETMEIRFLLDDELIAVFDREGTWRVAPDGERTREIEGGWGNGAGAFPNPFGFDRPHQLVLSAWVGAPEVDSTTVARGFDPPGGEAALQVDHVRVYAWR